MLSTCIKPEFKPVTGNTVWSYNQILSVKEINHEIFFFNIDAVCVYWCKACNTIALTGEKTGTAKN